MIAASNCVPRVSRLAAKRRKVAREGPRIKNVCGGNGRIRRIQWLVSPARGWGSVDWGRRWRVVGRGREQARRVIHWVIATECKREPP